MKLLVLTVLMCVALAAAQSGRSASYSGGASRVRDGAAGTSSSGRQNYQRQGSGGAYSKGGDYVREKVVREKERGSQYDAGRAYQGGERGGSSGRTGSFARERTDQRNYDRGFAPGVLY